MAYTIENTYTGNGSTVLYSFTFPYLETTDIKITLDEVANTAWTLASATQVQFNSAPGNNVAIRIYRDTNIDNLQSEFFSGSAIRSQDLNNDFNQTLYVSQETEAATLNKWNKTTDTIDSTEAFADVNTKIMTAAAIDDRINANIAVQPLANGKIFAGNGSGVAAAVTPSGDLTMANTGAFTIAPGSVEHAMLANDAVDGDNIADDSVDSEHYVDGSIDAAHLANDSVNVHKLADNAVVNASIDASAAIAHSKLASITSGRILVGNGSNVPTAVAVSGDVTLANTGAVTIATGAVEHAMLATDAVDGDNIADDSVDSEHYVDGSIDLVHMSANSVDSDQYVDGSIDHVHLATDAVDGDNIADNSIDSEHYVDGSIDNEHLADDAVGADELAANAVVNASVASGAAIDHSKLAAVSSGNVIVGNGSNVPTSVAMSGDVAIAAGGATTIQANAVEIGMIGCEQTTITDSDSHIPTSGAVVDYVASIINPIGGLEVIADDESFPNTIPAAGVVISITDAAGLQVNSSGVSTNGDALDNSTITINGFPSELRGGVGSNPDPYVFQSGAGLMVVSTGSSQTYNYHQAMIRESDFVQLSDDINDFNNRYRIHAGEPSSNNDDGDLVWDTNADKMKVYDATASAWTEVTSTGDFKYLVMTNPGTTNAATLNGSNVTFDLKESSTSGSAAAVTSAAQLIVSVNGVVQKANTGTSPSGLDGFVMADADTITFCAGIPSGADVFIVQVGSAVSIPTPGDNTVSAAKIQTGAVSLDKMASESVDEDNLHISNAGSNGQFLSKQSGNAGGLTWADAVPTGGGTFTGNVYFESEIGMINGTTNAARYIDAGLGDNNALWIRGTSGGDTNHETLAKFTRDEGVELYFDTAKKFETVTGGATITGVCTATSFAGDGSALTGVSSALSYRNKVINGDFSVSQRYGTTSNNADGYVIDRWYTQLSGATGTQQQHVFSAGSEIEGTKTYGKLDISSSGDWCSLRYRIEDVRTIIPGSWTLSFWAKGTTPPGGLKFWATQDFGSAGSADVDIGETALTALDGTWTRQSLTVTVASLSSKTINDNDSFFNFHIGQGSNAGSTAWNIEITNVQFEEGSSATAFEKKPYLHELTDCKRYFYMAADGSKGTAKHMSQWVAYTSGSIWLDFLHPVEMRAIPSMYEVSGAQGGNYWRGYHDGGVFYPDELDSANMTQTGASVTITDDVSVTSGEAGMFWVNNSAARLGFDAEL